MVKPPRSQILLIAEEAAMLKSPPRTKGQPNRCNQHLKVRDQEDVIYHESLLITWAADLRMRHDHRRHTRRQEVQRWCNSIAANLRGKKPMKSLTKSSEGVLPGAILSRINSTLSYFNALSVNWCRCNNHYCPAGAAVAGACQRDAEERCSSELSCSGSACCCPPRY